MRRLYEPAAYDERAIRARFWPTTLDAPAPVYPELTDALRCDFVIIGGGYTGVSAALTLIEEGADVVLLDAATPGWGASGRNGGLVSTGSAGIDDADVIRKAGAEDAQVFFNAERAAVDLVEASLETFGIDVDRHSDGYSVLAHNAAAVPKLQAYGAAYQKRYGLAAAFTPKEALAAEGMSSPALHAAAHFPIGFALNPMKFILGLTRAAATRGVRLHSNTPVTRITSEAGRFLLRTPKGRVDAKKLLIATNGYSSDDLPAALAGRYLPVQSNILVTRPLSDAEIAAQGWSSAQMAYDTPRLLHYFRLMPDRRFLFGLRGSVRATDARFMRARTRTRTAFERMFPAWRSVEAPFFWSGLICMTRALTPFAGPLPGAEGQFAALGYHGGGVAMAPYAGALMADLALGRARRPHPELMKRPLRRFELGRWRRSALPPVFAWYRFRDAF